MINLSIIFYFNATTKHYLVEYPNQLCSKYFPSYMYYTCLFYSKCNERASSRWHELKLAISLETLRSAEWTAFIGSKLERKPVPYSSLHNRYEATRTGLPSPGNEVARLPKGDTGRKRRGCREGARWRFGRGLNLFVGSVGSLLMPWLVLRFPLCHPT